MGRSEWPRRFAISLPKTVMRGTVAEALMALARLLADRAQAQFPAYSVKISPMGEKSAVLYLGFRRGLRSGATAQVGIDREGMLRVQITPDSRLVTTLALIVLLIALAGGALTFLVFGFAFAPRYQQYSGQVGIIGAIVVGGVAAISIFGTLQPLSVSRDSDAFCHQLYDCLETTLLELSSAE